MVTEKERKAYWQNCKYPQRGKSTHDGLEIMFTKPCYGTVTGNPTSRWKIGVHSTTWTMVAFEPIKEVLW